MFQVVDRPKLYEQVVEQIKNMIVQGIYKKGDLLPSEKELIEMTGVSRITVREALRLLNEAGVIETHKGKGSFVADTGRMKAGRIREWERSFDGLVEEAGQLGIGCETVVERVRRKYEKTGEPDGERGMSDDSSGKPDKTL